MSSILITGATGFIGSRLAVDLTDAGYPVVALARNAGSLDAIEGTPIEIRHGDITDLRSVVESCRNVDVAVHLAAITSSGGADYEKSFQVNVVGSQNLIDGCRMNGVNRIIYLGTQSDNTGAYATTKKEAERLLLESGLDVTVIRPSLVYGPGGRGLVHAMSEFIRKSPVIPIVGSGKYMMRPIYVSDVTQAIVRCIERSPAGTEYNISGSVTLPYRQFVDRLAKAMGVRRTKIYVPYSLTFFGLLTVTTFWRSFPITIDTLRGLVNPRVHDSDAAEKDLGFSPIELDEGLRRTFAKTA